MSLVVFPFKDESDALVAANIGIAARSDRVSEVWGVASSDRALSNGLIAATEEIATATSTPVTLHVEERIGAFRRGKGDAMNTAIRMAAGQGRTRAHFYDADITNFEESWIEGAETAADRGFGVVRHRFPRSSTDAMVTWMITRPGLAIGFPSTLLPRLDQPLGGEVLLGRSALEALASSPSLAARSDWGIDTLITFETSLLDVGIWEHLVVDGKRHALYGSLDELRAMALECLDAVRSIQSRPGPDPAATHGSDMPARVPPDLKRTVAYDIETTITLLTRGWADGEMDLAATLPSDIASEVLINRERPNFAFMDAENWYRTIRVLLDGFRLGDPAYESLAFRLWLIRVVSYTTNQALGGYGSAMRYLGRTIDEYEKWSTP